MLIGAADVLAALYGSVLIPQTVAAELFHARTPIAVRDWIAQTPAWVHIEADPPDDELLRTLDPGERAAILPAQSLLATQLLIDDYDGRAEAQRRGLRVTGTLGVLAAAHLAGLVDFDNAIKRLLTTSFYLFPRLPANARKLLSLTK